MGWYSYVRVLTCPEGLEATGNRGIIVDRNEWILSVDQQNLRARELVC